MSRNRKRMSKGARRRKARDWNRLARDVGATDDNENYLRIDCDSLEFACLFTVQGGQDSIGPGTVKATDQNGRRPGIRFGGKNGVAVAEHVLNMDRGKVGRMIAQWKDAEAIMEIRERILDKRIQMREGRFERAVENDAIGWFRQDAPGVDMRSVLLGTNRGVNPSEGSDGIVTSYRTEIGEYKIAREFWSGGWSAPDENGDRHRVGVTLDHLPISFQTAREAQEAFFHAVDEGASLNFESGASLEFGSIKSAHRIREKASRLKRWEHNGVDMKKVYAKQPPQTKKPTPKNGKRVVEGVA